jgi:hypothetical protein
MNKIKIFKRFKVYLAPGFGLLIANDNPTVLILIGFVAIEFDYTGLCRKKKPRFNLKKENRF